ncbi:MAG: metallophosphoesterase, partial [Pseudomonadales bacterium]|nr:metallophosphoesterase [Pseudomonadales bacterium]
MQALLVPGMLAAYVAAETASLTAERLTVWDSQLPKNFHNYKVAFASDLHHGSFCGVRRMQKMVRKMNDFDPDIMVLGGDYLQSLMSAKKNKKYLSFLGVELKKLEAPDGVLAVLGNHDHEVGVEKVCQEFRDCNIKIINNDGVWIERGGERIRIAGVGDLWYDKQDL